MPSEDTRPVSVSSSFRSENSGTASPSLYAQQSPCLYPVHSGPSLGNHAQLQPGRPLSTVRVSCRGPRGSTPQPSFPHPQRATLSGDPCCQPVCGLCSSVLAWESSLPPLENSPFLQYPEPAHPVCLPLIGEPHETLQCPVLWAVLYSRDFRVLPLH